MEKNRYQHITSLVEQILKIFENAHEQVLQFITSEMITAVNILLHENVNYAEVEQ